MAYVEALTGIDIEFGRKLWQSLRSNKTFPFQDIFWLFQMESGEWHLLIATPRVDSVGPEMLTQNWRKSPNIFQQTLTKLFKIELISPKHPFYQALRSVFAQTASVEGTRLAILKSEGCTSTKPTLYEIR